MNEIITIIEGYRAQAIDDLTRLAAGITMHCMDPDDQTMAALALEAEAAAIAVRKYLSNRQSGDEIAQAAGTIVRMADDLKGLAIMHPAAVGKIISIKAAAQLIQKEVA